MVSPREVTAAMSTDAFDRAEKECQRLAQGFVCHLDQARYDEVSGLFTEDGILHRVSGESLHGRTAIAAGLRRPAGQVVIHLASPVHFAEAGAGEATGVSSFVAFLAMPGRPEVRVAAIWHDRYRHENGAWRIAERSVDVRMSGASH